MGFGVGDRGAALPHPQRRRLEAAAFRAAIVEVVAARDQIVPSPLEAVEAKSVAGAFDNDGDLLGFFFGLEGFCLVDGLRFGLQEDKIERVKMTKS